MAHRLLLRWRGRRCGRRRRPHRPEAPHRRGLGGHRRPRGLGHPNRQGRRGSRGRGPRRALRRLRPGRRRRRPREHCRRHRAGRGHAGGRARTDPARALGDQSLGDDPESGRPIYLKTGRYGPYVQLGEDEDDGGKPRRASLWPGMRHGILSPEDALAAPRVPEDAWHAPGERRTRHRAGRPQRAVREGRQREPQPARSRAHAHHRARRGAADPRQPRQRGGRAAAAPLKELGEHPTSKQPCASSTAASGRTSRTAS